MRNTSDLFLFCKVLCLDADALRLIAVSLGVNTILILTQAHCFSLWQVTSEHAGAAADDIVARGWPTPVHISDGRGGQAFAKYRPRTTDDITMVTASEDQPGSIHAVVFYISAMARRGFY